MSDNNDLDELKDDGVNLLKSNMFTEMLSTLGKLASFSKRFFVNVIKPPYETTEFFKQAYHFGNGSLGLVGITSFIVGMVLTLQTQPTLEELGAESWLPAMISVSVVREIGPLITALICAGKIGSNLGAEIGSMKVTEQIDAMLVSGAKPINFIVTTRVMAVAITLPILVLYADLLAFTGSYLSMQMEMPITLRLFLIQALDALDFKDVIPAFLKTFLFGLAIGLVGCFNGYNASKGTTGVGNAANKSVVQASLLIFIIDLVVVQAQKLIF